jgi:hypothetical protein
MPRIDLTTFKPSSAGELAEGILGELVSVLGDSWREASAEVEGDVRACADASYHTLTRLANGEISQKKADALLHMQELFLNQIFLNVEFWGYVIAQRALDAVIGVVMAAVKNVTGFDLDF